MYFRNSALIGENRGVPNTTHARMSACLIHFWGARRARYPSLYNPNMFMLARYSNYDAREHKNSRYQTKIPLNWNKNYSQCNMTDVNEPVFLVLRVGVTS